MKKNLSGWAKTREFINQMHLWVGLGIGLIVILVCLSGTIYVFNDEIREAATPELFKVKAEGNQKESERQAKGKLKDIYWKVTGKLKEHYRKAEGKLKRERSSMMHTDAKHEHSWRKLWHVPRS